MTTGLSVVLLLFAAVGYLGTGASLAVARKRYASDDEPDFGMLAIAVMLAAFAILCTVVATGLSGVVAFGAVATWASYMAAAGHLGLFRLEVTRYEQPIIRAPHQRT